MWTWLASFLGGPVINGLISAYKEKLKTEGAETQIAANLAARELQVQALETQAQSQLRVAEIGHPWEPEKLFAYVTLFFYAKVLIYDKCLGLGVTPDVGGNVAQWAGLIMSFYFGKRTIENAIRIFKRQ